MLNAFLTDVSISFIVSSMPEIFSSIIYTMLVKLLFVFVNFSFPEFLSLCFLLLLFPFSDIEQFYSLFVSLFLSFFMRIIHFPIVCLCFFGIS